MLRRRTSTKPADKRGRRPAVLNLSPLGQDAPAPAAPDDGPGPVLDPLLAHDTLGEALRAIRHDRGLTLQAVAEVTRVRRAYLEAIEEMRLDALPSRPFTVGYIRAYATALGVDPDAAIERFKTDEPVLDEPLRAPVGVLDERDPRVAAFLVAALLIVAAIVVWNVAQRAMTANAPPPELASDAVTAEALKQVKGGTMELGYPLPAPVESTPPPPYETPGLAASLGLPPDAVAAAPKQVNEAVEVDLSQLAPVFQPRGRIYDAGNPRLTSLVTLQALKNAGLILRGPDGSVYFARQLIAGEAYRLPQSPGLTVDVSEPHAFQVFVAGRSAGVLPAQQTLASKLVAAPPPAPAAPRPAAPPAPAPKATATPSASQRP